MSRHRTDFSSPTDFGLPPELTRMPWKKFLRDAVFPSSMADYWYCAGKIVNMQLYGSMETAVTEKGSVYHEEVTVKIIRKLGPLRKVKIETVYDVMKHAHDNIRGALREGGILANSEDTILFRSVSPELKIAGTPDKADCRNGREPIVMDFKTTWRLPSEAWPNNRIQLGAYMIGVERLGFRQSYGVLRYILESNRAQYREFKVYLDDYLRNEVRSTAELVRAIFQGGKVNTTSNPRKCAPCSYHELCEWSLTREGPYRSEKEETLGRHDSVPSYPNGVSASATGVDFPDGVKHVLDGRGRE